MNAVPDPARGQAQLTLSRPRNRGRQELDRVEPGEHSHGGCECRSLGCAWSAASVVVAALSLVGLVGGPAVGAAPTFPAVDQPGVTTKEIKVGGVVTASNDPTGGTLDTAYDGVEAYFDYVNSKGGVYGRKLVLDAKHDDQLANNRGEVQNLLTNDDVFAVDAGRGPALHRRRSCSPTPGARRTGGTSTRSGARRTTTPGPSNFFTNVGDYHLLHLRHCGPAVVAAQEAEASPHRQPRVQRLAVDVLRRGAREEPQEVQDRQDRVPGQEPDVRHPRLQRAGRADEGQERRHGHHLHRRQRGRDAWRGR